MKADSKKKFRKAPLCEKCGKAEAISFSLIKGKWMFTCMCTADNESYYIELDRFFRSPASTVDWLAHMSEKPWMDCHDFMEMMHRFRGATNSFCCLGT